ncbi:MAG: NTP transferase domain-containing protein [Bacteroidia bacterium]|nr:NTP transferase domain-containing protein [Bacteroidia bacterium]
MEKNKNHYAIIMAGGIGSRFWPYSRTQRPKQFLDILGIGKTLLQSTYERFLKAFEKDNIYIVTNQSYIPLIKEQLPDINDKCLLGEPIAKNTAACIAYATSKIHEENTHGVFIVAPSDHLILNENAFIESVELAMNYAKSNKALITLGIKPNRPDTGYGYIQYIENDKDKKINKVKTFTEKPSLDLAQTFIESGDFLWNAGIFIWSGSTIREAFKTHLPEFFELFNNASKFFNKPEEASIIQSAYEQCRSVSIDVGLMEKAQNVFVIPGDFGWSDLGTWASLYDYSDQKDDGKNVVFDKSTRLYNDTTNCLVSSSLNKNKLIVLNGVNNLIVVDTEDVLLISDKSKEQEIKQIVADVKLKYDEKYS